MSSPSECPVAHDGGTPAPTKAVASQGSAAAASGCPVVHAPAASSGGCPVDHRSPTKPVNAEHVLPPNQTPGMGQRAPLPTGRAVSSIPSAAGGDPLWVYPSEQMFYNAMKRKGFKPHEEEMSAVVAIHNAVNERAWAEVSHRR